MGWIVLATVLGLLAAQADTLSDWPGLWGPSRNAITRSALPDVVSRAEVVWRERTGAGTVIAIDDKLVFLSQDAGEVQIARISSEAFRPTLRARVLAADVRAVTGPSFAGNQLYVRSLNEIVALRLLAN